MYDKVVIVTRLTRLEESIRKFNTREQAKFYITNRGQSFQDYELEYDNYSRVKDLILKSIEPGVKFHVIDRSYLPNYLFAKSDLVLTLGQDGLVVNTAKYLNEQPIFAVNPDPDRFDGVLLPFTAQHPIRSLLNESLEGKFQFHEISMGKVTLSDNQSLYAFNDFFIGPKTQSSARYTIKIGELSERQISSGIIVSTPAGSTGWFSSLFHMANGIHSFSQSQSQSNQKSQTQEERQPILMPAKNWSDRNLFFAVREPFLSQWSGVDLVAGTISEGRELILESHMPENGFIFSDGMDKDFLDFSSGTTARIGLADKKTFLIQNPKTD
jgi:NAD kinase